jgi:hypothetical protein
MQVRLSIVRPGQGKLHRWERRMVLKNLPFEALGGRRALFFNQGHLQRSQYPVLISCARCPKFLKSTSPFFACEDSHTLSVRKPQFGSGCPPPHAPGRACVVKNHTGETVSHYHIIKEIGVGGMSFVYRCSVRLPSTHDALAVNSG